MNELKGTFMSIQTRRAAKQFAHSQRPGRLAGVAGLESLESRTVLSATLMVDGTLLLVGSAQADTIVIEARPADGRVAITGIPDVANGTIFDNVRRVQVEAGSGNDSVSVLGSAKSLDGAKMRFTMFGGNGNDTLSGSGAVDDLRGGNGGDTIFGKGGADLISGGNGGDFLAGQRGNDLIEGGNARDTLLGGPNNDVLVGGNGDDLLRGGGGEDTLRAGFGEDDLFGGRGEDDLFGNADRDLLRGPSSEFEDFNDTDAFHSPVVGTSNQGLAELSDQFWLDVAAQAGEGDLAEDSVRALDSLQLIRARVADERLEFDQAFAQLTPQERADARAAFGGIFDDFLADIQGTPGDLSSGRLLELQANVRDEFPSDVRGEFDDYIEEMIQLNDQVSDLGDSMDSLQDRGLEAPYMTAFGTLFDF